MLGDDEKIPGASVVSKACSHRNLLKARRKEKRKKRKEQEEKSEAETTPHSNDIVDSKTTVNNPTEQPNRNTGDLFPQCGPG